MTKPPKMALQAGVVAITSSLLPKLRGFHFGRQNNRHVRTIGCLRTGYTENIPSDDPDGKWGNRYLKKGPARPHEAKQGKNGMMIVRIDMPGVDEHSLMIWIDKDSVHFHGESELRLDYEYQGRVYNGTINVNPEIYITDMVKTEMHNGILWLVVPQKPRRERHPMVGTASATDFLVKTLKKEEILLSASSSLC